MRRAGFMLRAMRQTAVAACLAVLLTVSAFARDGTNSPATTFKQPKTLAELLAVPPDQLDKVDIGVMDLLCAEGLPGTEHVDVQEMVSTLDSWASWIARITKQNYHRFTENPKYFNNSEGDYRMAMLATTLQRDFGVRYNPVRAEAQRQGGPYAEPESIFFADSKDIFIHGLLADKRYGTCASMPVLYVALAKRLGYPVKLVASTSHAFVRYDEGDHHFDVEATSRGFSVFQDDHYKDWPVHTSDEEIAKQHYLEPMTAKQILAELLSTRAVCLKATGQLEKAREAMATARDLAPELTRFQMMLDAYNEELTDSRKKAKWDRLTNEISNLPLPDAENFDSFRDRKIALHFHLMQTGDLDGAEKALDALKGDIAAENLRDTARVALSTNTAPRSNVNTVILLRRVKYLTPGGQEIELTEQSPGQMDSLLREQRILDKAVAVEQGKREAMGLPPVPWQAIRPAGVQTRPQWPREVALQKMEESLDETLKNQQAAADLKNQTAQGNATSAIPTSGASKDAQAALDFINRVNALSGQNRTAPASPFASSLPQFGDGLPTGVPPNLQNLMNMVNGMSGRRDGTVPMPNPFSPQQTIIPDQEGLPPETQAALKQINEAYELKRQLDLIQQATNINSAPTGKAQK